MSWRKIEPIGEIGVHRDKAINLGRGNKKAGALFRGIASSIKERVTRNNVANLLLPRLARLQIIINHLDGKRSGRRDLDVRPVAPNRLGNLTGANFGGSFGKFAREGSTNGSFTLGAALIPLQSGIASVELVTEKILKDERLALGPREGDSSIEKNAMHLGDRTEIGSMAWVKPAFNREVREDLSSTAGKHTNDYAAAVGVMAHDHPFFGECQVKLGLGEWRQLVGVRFPKNISQRSCAAG
jgi:hypothetical protein